MSFIHLVLDFAVYRWPVVALHSCLPLDLPCLFSPPVRFGHSLSREAWGGTKIVFLDCFWLHSSPPLVGACAVILGCSLTFSGPGRFIGVIGSHGGLLSWAAFDLEKLAILALLGLLDFAMSMDFLPKWGFFMTRRVTPGSCVRLTWLVLVSATSWMPSEARSPRSLTWYMDILSCLGRLLPKLVSGQEWEWFLLVLPEPFLMTGLTLCTSAVDWYALPCCTNKSGSLVASCTGPREDPHIPKPGKQWITWLNFALIECCNLLGHASLLETLITTLIGSRRPPNWPGWDFVTSKMSMLKDVGSSLRPPAGVKHGVIISSWARSCVTSFSNAKLLKTIGATIPLWSPHSEEGLMPVFDSHGRFPILWHGLCNVSLWTCHLSLRLLKSMRIMPGSGTKLKNPTFVRRFEPVSPVVRACAGRGKTTKPSRRVHQLAPVKIGRAGDRVPEFFGSNLQHLQWTKQSRRLQSYVRLAAAEDKPAHRAHRFQLWNSIVLAPGFAPTFSCWWAHRALCLGEPAQVPSQPPSADVANLIRLGLDFELSQLEKALRASRSHLRKLRYTSDAGALYREVKRDPPVQVDTLLRSLRSRVSFVHLDDSSVSLEPPCPWISSQPFAHASGSLEPIHIEPDRLWLPDVSPIAVGDTISQETCHGSLEALFEAFETQWAELWQKHDKVPESQWDSILQFASAHLRPVDAVMPPITNDQIRLVARSKRPRAATGLDGVARADILALCPSELDAVRAMYVQAETSGQWPSALLHGGVRSLAKIPDPTDVSHFRPICVFGFLYRIWSSIHSRFWLSALADGVDAWLCGNRKHCQAATVWSHLMERVETARHADAPVSGITLDIVKAFNCLPRKPTLHAAKLMGVAQQTLVGWAGALAQIHRRFIVRGSYSGGLQSSCGLPEGCGLSCVGMFAICQLFFAWMRASVPQCQVLTFVDDWSILLSDVTFAQEALDSAIRFTQALDLSLDKTKTFSWSSHIESRKALRAMNHRVVGSCRELGAHLTFTRQITNKTLGTRLTELQDFWSKLRASPCSFLQKIQLIHRVAWPRALHAVSAVVVGKKRFAALRTCYLRSVHLDKPGVNPFLQCFLDGLCMDPQLFAILSTIRDFRVHGQSADSLLNLCQSCQVDSPEVWSHATSVLRQRVEQCGFRLNPDGAVLDRFGVFDLATCPFGELLRRLEYGWTLKVAAAVSHRSPFSDFCLVDAAATRLGVRRLANFDQGIVRRHLNGASFTNEHAKYWNTDGQSLCIHCGSLDSLFHRLWVCDSTASLRKALPEVVLHAQPSLPSVCSVHGWTLCSPSRDAWLSYLSTLPCDPVFQWPPVLPVILDLFTDGTAWCPADPYARVAAWSVVLSAPCLDSHSPWHVFPIAGQPLAGLTQTVFRAELRAVVAAVDFSIRAGRSCRIWTDCQAVVNGYAKFVTRRFPINPNMQHADLWRELQILVWEAEDHCFQVIKVPSHLGLHDDLPAFDRWFIIGNDAAHRTAKVANQQRGTTVWSLWKTYVSESRELQAIGQAIRWYQVQVAHLWTPHPGPQEASAPVPVAAPIRTARTFCNQWSCPEVLPTPTGPFKRLFGQTLLDRVSTWFQSVHAPGNPVHWISFYQLYAHFIRSVDVLILKLDGKWTVDFSKGARLRTHFRLAVRVKAFRLMLQQWLKDHKILFHTATLRPRSNWIVCHRGCLAFPMVDDEWHSVETFFGSVMDKPASGQGKCLDKLRF